MPLPGLPAGNCGPMRVWLAAPVDSPGLAMSRSIGDSVSHKVGVISEPEVRTEELKGTTGYLAWASDGVFEFLQSEDVCKMVWDNKDDLDKAVTELVEKSSKCWFEEEGDVCDDITCVIMKWNDVGLVQS